jgi:cytochrome c peroxidase
MARIVARGRGGAAAATRSGGGRRESPGPAGCSRRPRAGGFRAKEDRFASARAARRRRAILRARRNRAARTQHMMGVRAVAVDRRAAWWTASALALLTGVAGVCRHGHAAGTAPVPVPVAATAPPPSGAPEPIRPLPPAEPADPGRVRLGAALFVDRRLSGGHDLACVSCHDLRTNGANCMQAGPSERRPPLRRSTLTVFNSSLNYRQFWDGRAATQQEVVDDVIRNPREMNSSWAAVLAALRKDGGMVERFAEVYPDGIQQANVEDALAAFLRSLRTPNARIDRYLEGDASALGADELRGYRLFKEYGCAACHQGANVGGNMFQVLGVVRRPPGFGDEAAAGADWGRYEITHREADRLVFRVPSLRNVAVTAPYLHDGSAATLEDAVRVMFEYQLGRHPSGEDIDLIVKFLGTLTGEYQGRPLTKAAPEAAR